MTPAFLLLEVFSPYKSFSIIIGSFPPLKTNQYPQNKKKSTSSFSAPRPPDGRDCFSPFQTVLFIHVFYFIFLEKSVDFCEEGGWGKFQLGKRSFNIVQSPWKPALKLLTFSVVDIQFRLLPSSRVLVHIRGSPQTLSRGAAALNLLQKELRIKSLLTTERLAFIVAVLCFLKSSIETMGSQQKDSIQATLHTGLPWTYGCHWSCHPHPPCSQCSCNPTHTFLIANPIEDHGTSAQTSLGLFWKPFC